MARGMARRGIHEQAVFDRVTAFHGEQLAGFEHRQEAVLPDRTVVVAGTIGVGLGLGRGQLGFRAEHFRVRERRHPAPVAQLRVPAHMVHMQVGAQHEVDVFGLEARLRQPLEVRLLEVVESRRVRACLVVADAGVDEDDVPLRAQEPRMRPHHEAFLHRVVVVGCEPAEVALDRLRGQVGQEVGRRERRAERLLDAHHLDGTAAAGDHAGTVGGNAAKAASAS